MNTPPEADNEYSRAAGAFRALLPRRHARDSRALEVHGDGVGSVVTLGALLAAAVLIGCEFATLYAVRVPGKVAPVGSIATGSHHDYAMIPIGVLAAVLALALRRGVGRPVLLALAALAMIALVIALLDDLPAAHRTGLIAVGAGYELGTSSPRAGFYLETLGAVLLLICSGVGLLAGAGERPVRRKRPG